MHHVPISALRGVAHGRLAVRPDYYSISAPGFPLYGHAVPTGRWVILSREPLTREAPRLTGGLRHPRQVYAGLHAYPLPTHRAALELAQRIIRRRRGARKPLTELRATITIDRETQAERRAAATRDAQMLMTYTPPTLAAMAARSDIPLASLMRVR